MVSREELMNKNNVEEETKIAKVKNFKVTKEFPESHLFLSA
jgi:hypothetical protein